MYLVSDDNSNLTSIAADKSELSELNTEATIITATIDEANSQDITIPFKVTGTASFEVDYTASFETKKHSVIAGGTDATSNLSGFNNTYALFIDSNAVSYTHLTLPTIE